MLPCRPKCADVERFIGCCPEPDMRVQGYCFGKITACQKFPVVVGEMGSRMIDCRNPCNTRQPNCMAAEMQVRGSVTHAATFTT